MRFLLYRRRSLKSPLILAYLAIASKALIEAKILQRYAMITAPAARRRGADLPRDLNYAFIIGNLSGESLLKILRMALSSMTNSVSSHTGSGKPKGLSCRSDDCNARRLPFRLTQDSPYRRRLCACCTAKNLFETSTRQRGALLTQSHS